MGAPSVWFDLTTTSDNSDGVGDFYADCSAGQSARGWATTRALSPTASNPGPGFCPPTRRAPGRWIPFVVVDDLDAAAKQAVALGGSIVRDKTDGPAGTSIVVTDPGGAAVALFTPTTG